MLKRTWIAAAVLVAGVVPAAPAGPWRDVPGAYSRWAYWTPTLYRWRNVYHGPLLGHNPHPAAGAVATYIYPSVPAPPAGPPMAVVPATPPPPPTVTPPAPPPPPAP
jgi:hypothetical protein